MTQTDHPNHTPRPEPRSKRAPRRPDPTDAAHVFHMSRKYGITMKGFGLVIGVLIILFFAAVFLFRGDLPWDLLPIPDDVSLKRLTKSKVV